MEWWENKYKLMAVRALMLVVLPVVLWAGIIWAACVLWEYF